MGSGQCNIYLTIKERSQDFAKEYKVTADMLERDKMDVDIYNPFTGYFLNPTATNLKESIIDDDIYIEDEKADGSYIYVMDSFGNIIFGLRQNPNNIEKRCPHPTLIGGLNPKVQCAGIIVFKNGKIFSIDNRSGHFKPNIQSLDKVDSFMNDLCKENSNLFKENSKWRKK